MVNFSWSVPTKQCFLDWKEETMTFQFWPVEYALDALNVLNDKESSLPVFQFQSPQLSSRPTLLKVILHLGELFKLGRSTVHLAVFILDRFMDEHSIQGEKLNLTALTSLQLAAKYEERDDCAPKISDLIAVADIEYQRFDFVQFESLILKYLDWNLSHPTAVKFMEYFSLVAVSRSEWQKQQFSSYEEFWCQLQRAIQEYLDLSLEEVQMHGYKPSLVACSCIILARRRFGLRPLWTPRLIQTTRYKWRDVSPCTNALLRFTCKNTVKIKRKPTDSPDQGYVTEEHGKTPPSKKVCRSQN